MKTIQSLIINEQKAAKILKNGGLVAFPTETVYGLGADATNKNAIEKVFLAKNRPSDNPLICHFYSLNQILEYVEEVPDFFSELVKKFSPGPISYLLKLPENSVLKHATRGQNSVICRIPKHPKTLEIIRLLNKPIVGPSANTSTKFSGTSAQMVFDDLGEKLDGIIDGGESQIGLESTILDCRINQKKGRKVLKILRPGSIGKIEIEKFFQKNNLEIKVEEINKNLKEVTPGAKYRHYSPKTPIYKVATKDLKQFEEEIKNQENFAIIYIGNLETTNLPKNFEKENLKSKKNIKFISLGKTPQEAAKNLYQKMYDLDKINLQKAYFIEYKWNGSSIEKAIQNRLSKIVL